jgi:hypothetical protein
MYLSAGRLHWKSDLLCLAATKGWHQLTIAGIVTAMSLRILSCNIPPAKPIVILTQHSNITKIG